MQLLSSGYPNNSSPEHSFLQPEVSRLGDVAEIKAQNFNFALKFNQRTELELNTKPAVWPMRG
ncbi:hypothetical protein ABIB40_004089 [Pedobacter sp. UYP30]|uniref:hypothetical protein n=1 Tax=Pedobacter sp. UYP30 TaxID=1756400 RepID=UPI00339ACB9E